MLAGPDAPAAHEAAAIAGQIGIDLARDVATASGGERRRAAIVRALAAAARRAAARRADQPPRSRRHRLARGLAGALQGRVHRHQPRPHLPDPADQELPVARPRRRPPRGDRLRRLRCVDREGLCRGGARGRQARRQAEARAALAAARRDRAAAAQPGAAGQAPRDARPARGDARAGRAPPSWRWPRTT